MPFPLWHECLFVYRYAGNSYTAAYRYGFIESTLDRLRTFLDGDLLCEYERVIKFGTPTVLNAETSRESALLHLSEGKYPLINKNLTQVMGVMNKEE